MEKSDRGNGVENDVPVIFFTSVTAHFTCRAYLSEQTMPFLPATNPTYFIAVIDGGDSAIEKICHPQAFLFFVKKVFVWVFVFSFHMLQPPNLAVVGVETTVVTQEVPRH